VKRKGYRLAAIDVGTNSIHMIIVEAEGRGYRVIDKEKEMVQLGRGSLGGNPLTREAISRGIAALQTMREIARRWEVDDLIAVATSALREAPNRQDFLDAAEQIAGVHLQVISGEEEADYIFGAVRGEVDFRGGTALCIDIGGGSMELIAGTAEEIYYTASEPLGALRLTQQFFSKHGGGLDACQSHVRKLLKRPLAHVRALGFDLSVGTSGTIMALAEMASGRPPEERPAAGLRWLPRVGLGLLIKKIEPMSVEKRAAAYGLEPRRAETVLAGAAVVHELLDVLDIDGLWACPAALREGIVLRALGRRRRAAEPTANVRAQSVLDLAERSNYDRKHAAHVARLALRIFDQTMQLHELGEHEREILQHAATLHEIGVHVSFQRHHRHTYYLIRHAGLRGFSDEEVAMIANVARYYRKATPGEDDENLLELGESQRRIVEKLVSIIRIADGLDRGHNQNVRDVNVKVKPRRVRFEIRPRGNAELEMASAERRGRYFGRLFGTKVDVATTRAE
jgi:exopolyphosphatase / guanosine-5'-triphosphate,3'-diphosphate pyrophosphatase